MVIQWISSQVYLGMNHASPKQITSYLKSTESNNIVNSLKCALILQIFKEKKLITNII
jgi:hypothetical protein